MKRKLVKQGSATLMVSLPAKWIKANKLGKGSEIDLDEINDNLIISLDKLHHKTETSIKLPNTTEPTIRALITNAYRSGYDKILVNFDKEEQFKILDKIIKTRLIGFEVIKKSKNSCVVENITEPSHNQFENLFGKMFENIDLLLNITEKRLKKQEDEEDYEEVEERIQKYDNFCRRAISDNQIEIKDTKLMWAFLSLIVHSQREIYFINKLIEKKTDIGDETILLLAKARELFNILIRAYREKNMELVAKLNALEREEIFKKGYKLLEKSKGKETIILFHLLSCIRRINQASSPLTGLII